VGTEDKATFKAKLVVARQKQKVADEPPSKPDDEQPKPPPRLPALPDDKWEKFERSLPRPYRDKD